MVTKTIAEGIPRKDSTQVQLATEKYHSATNWFWSGLKRYPALMIPSVAIILINAIVSIIPSILLGVAIDVLRNDGFTSTFIYLVLGIIGAAVLTWATSFLSAYMWGLSSYRFERDIRQEFFDVMQEHSMAFHDEHDSGILLSMGMNETNQIRMAYHPSLRHLIISLLSIITTTSYFFIRIKLSANYLIGVGYWPIGIAVTIGFVFYLLLAWRYASKIGPIRREVSKELANVSSASQETFRGIEVVRSFDNETVEEKKFNEQSTRLAEKVKEEGYLSAFYWPTLVMVLVTAAAFGVGMWLVTKGPTVLSVGQLTTMLTQLLSLVRLNFMIPMRLLMLQAGLINAKRIWDVMKFEDPLKEPSSSKEADWSKELVFDNVSFKYPGTKKYVLENISFSIPSGSRVALLGGPGSGKSTLLKLLLRFYDPSEGSIKLDGCSFDEMKTFDIRQDVTMVEQDIFLFAAPIRENIAFSDVNATEEEIILAATRAQAHDFIMATPEGYDTIIGERGVTLSGGQRQRLAIARALLANPKLLLLDDSTSAVDIKTEYRLRAAMEELIKGRTSIIVTQRLSTLVESDLIILLDKGKLVAIGNHDELLSSCKEYQFMLSHLPVGSQLVKEALEQGTAPSKEEH